ncbi:MAG: succinylglutamate desuccinylase/aspartoacylase family protein, partial [Pseudomonadales bacterium]
MHATSPYFEEWYNPPPEATGKDYLEFLRILTGPTWITIPGQDDSRNRAIVTLLHGNEPSGLKAIHRLITSGSKPATNLGIFIASVEAAKLDPPFSHRYLPEDQDLNRCFNPPFDTRQRKLARAILEKLESFAPEAIIDTHNTSAHSEPFAVATIDSARTLQLTQGFTRRLVVLDLTLGTLIEQQARLNCPVITIEFGGFMDPRADAMAIETLGHFASRHQLFDTQVMPLMLLRHPHRLEVDDYCELHYSSSVQDAADITVFNTIDQLNFSRIEKGTAIGWIDKPALSHLRIMSADGEDLLSDYLSEQDGFLVTQQPITLFMATTDPF